jgi:hypothetical protein
MADMYPPARQFGPLTDLLDALDARRNSLRRDDCGDWAIFGKFGHVYAVPLDRAVSREGYKFVFGMDRAVGLSRNGASLSWGTARRKLEAFCRLAQDGDDGGTLFLERLPTPEEAETIRGVMGIFRRRHLSAERLEALREHGRQTRFRRALEAA